MTYDQRGHGMHGPFFLLSRSICPETSGIWARGKRDAKNRRQPVPKAMPKKAFPQKAKAQLRHSWPRTLAGTP